MSGKPRIAAEVPDFGSRRQLERRRLEPVDPQDREVVARVEVDRLGGAGPARTPRRSTRVSSWPATTWALVTTTPGAATQPEPSTPTPHAVPRILTTLSRAAATSGSRAIAARGGGTRASGPSIRGNGSSARSVLSSGPVGGSTALSRAQDRRALDVAPDVRRRACSATAPSTQATSSPTHAVSTAPSGAVDRREGRRGEPGAQARAHPLEARRQHAAGHQRTDQCEGRRPLRLAAALQHQRRHARAQPGAGGEADEREDPCDEALRPAEQGEQHDRAEDDPVDAGHAPAAVFECDHQLRAYPPGRSPSYP